MKQYENPTIEIVEFNEENILTDSDTLGGLLPGDNEEDYNDFWN